jgi:diguanylate cyclase (GGDEF)-like protein
MSAEVLGAVGAPRILRSDAPDGRWVIPSARSLGVAGLRLVAQQDLAEAARPLLSVLTGTLATGAALLLLVVWRASWLAAGIARTAKTFSESAQRILQGELEVEIPSAEVPAELSLLADGYAEVKQRLRRSRQLENNNHALARRIEALQTENASLSKLSVTDGLTRLNNHRYFQDQLTTELKRLSRDGLGLSMMIIDIDDFKKLNDQHGHAAGDEILMQIARLLSETVRQTDLLARYGGEEFVVVATGTDLEGATVLGEKVRTAVAESSFIIDDTMRPRGVTVSIGVAQFSGNRNKLFQAADNALYRAKEAGKNCVIAADE